MILTPKLQKAINLASQLHANQTRKIGNLPYISHPFSVMLILLDYTQDENILIAALLHDILEDVNSQKYNSQMLIQDFGQKISQLIKDVSGPNSSEMNKDQQITSWQQRKKTYLKHLNQASEEGLMLCTADKIHNLQSLMESHQLYQDEMWQYFNAPPEQKYKFYQSVYKIIIRRLNHPIVDLFSSTLRQAEKTVFATS